MVERILKRRVRLDIPEGAGGEPIFVKIGSVVTDAPGSTSRTWKKDAGGAITNEAAPAPTDLFDVVGSSIVLK